jgi:hypothetical protein
MLTVKKRADRVLGVSHLSGVLGKGLTEASLYPVNMQRGGVEPRTGCSVGEFLTSCTKPALRYLNCGTIKLLSCTYRSIQSKSLN